MFSLLLPSAYSCALLNILHKALCILLQALYVKYKYKIPHLIVQGKQFEIDANTVNHKMDGFLNVFPFERESMLFLSTHVSYLKMTLKMANYLAML